MSASFPTRRFARDPDAPPVVNPKPVPDEWLRDEIRAAGERCRRARAQGWINEHQQSLEVAPEQGLRDQLDDEP